MIHRSPHSRIAVKASGLAVAAALSGSADAALYDRGNGMIYNDVLNITLLADPSYAATEFAANPNRVSEIVAAVGTVAGHALSSFDFVVASGRMSWWGAVAWADQLVYQGFSDWRLPKADPACAYNFNCTTNELGQLWYQELGGTAGQGATGVSVKTSGDPDLAKFVNLQDWVYWETANVDPGSPPDTNRGWDFHFGTFYRGYQFSFPKTNANFYAWAVRDGDVAPVPVPAAVWLFGSALSLLGWRFNRSTRAA